MLYRPTQIFKIRTPATFTTKTVRTLISARCLKDEVGSNLRDTFTVSRPTFPLTKLPHILLSNQNMPIVISMKVNLLPFPIPFRKCSYLQSRMQIIGGFYVCTATETTLTFQQNYRYRWRGKYLPGLNIPLPGNKRLHNKDQS